MVRIVLNFPDEALLDRYPSPEVFGEKMRLTAALAWYQQGDISLEEAAQIVGLNRQGFLAVLAERNINGSQIGLEKINAKKQAFFERVKAHKVYLPEDYSFNRDDLSDNPLFMKGSS
jgi:predicted HTH domain antitoxin